MLKPCQIGVSRTGPVHCTLGTLGTCTVLWLSRQCWIVVPQACCFIVSPSPDAYNGPFNKWVWMCFSSTCEVRQTTTGKRAKSIAKSSSTTKCAAVRPAVVTQKDASEATGKTHGSSNHSNQIQDCIGSVWLFLSYLYHGVRHTLHLRFCLSQRCLSIKQSFQSIIVRCPTTRCSP